MNDHSERARFTVPMWLIELVKLSVTGIIAFVLMYIRVAALESKYSEEKEARIKVEAKVESHSVIITANDGRVAILETRMAIMEKSITESLSRIESDVRDVKQDIKQLQRSSGK